MPYASRVAPLPLWGEAGINGDTKPGSQRKVSELVETFLWTDDDLAAIFNGEYRATTHCCKDVRGGSVAKGSSPDPTEYWYVRRGTCDVRVGEFG